MQVILQSVFRLRLRMSNAYMASLAEAALNNQAQLAATFNPLRLGDVGKTVARHKRAGEA